MYQRNWLTDNCRYVFIVLYSVMAAFTKVFKITQAKLLMIILAAVTVVCVFWYLASPTNSRINVNNMDSFSSNRYEAFNIMDNQIKISESPRFNLVNYEPCFEQKVVHLDLKGAPPKVAYLIEIFPLLAKLGATGILLEYEDMFPFWGEIKSISANNAYTKQDVADINKYAKKNGLQVIPLIQTFGHLEFLLKLEDKMHLREVPEYPQVICPSHNQTQPLLYELISQVAELHPDSSEIHVGADEVYYIGRCSSCQERLRDNYWSTTDLFLNHVTSVAKFIREKLHLKPIMWDDEFRSFSETDLIKSGIGNLVDVVVWNYGPSIQLEEHIWIKYFKVFNAIWVASAFKGATGSDQQITNINHHMENHLAWMALVSSYSQTPNRSKFKGIMMTGWQRYDHFAVLCELLPVSIPSLAVNLQLVQQGNYPEKILKEVQNLLGCSLPFWSNPGLVPSSVLQSCQYPGADVSTVVQNLVRIKEQFQILLNDSVVRGWMTGYNRQHQFSSPAHLERIGNELFYLKNQLDNLARDGQETFLKVYDEFTFKEWVQTYLTPLLSSINSLIEAKDIFTSRNVWPKRPLDL